MTREWTELSPVLNNIHQYSSLFSQTVKKYTDIFYGSHYAGKDKNVKWQVNYPKFLNLVICLIDIFH